VGVLRGTGHREVTDGGVLGDRGRASVEQLDALVERARSAGLAVTVERDGTPPALPTVVELTVYRLAQEALTNVLRHAGPDAKVAVTIGYRPEVLELSIVDDGGGRSGAGRHPPDTGSGNGLVGMRERVSVLGGH